MRFILNKFFIFFALGILAIFFLAIFVQAGAVKDLERIFRKETKDFIQLEEIGSSKIVFFPIPHLRVSNVEAFDVLEENSFAKRNLEISANEVNIFPSILSFFTGELKISKIIIDKGEFAYKENNLDKDDLFSLIHFVNDFAENSFAKGNIVIKNSSFINSNKTKKFDAKISYNFDKPSLKIKNKIKRDNGNINYFFSYNGKSDNNVSFGVSEGKENKVSVDGTYDRNENFAGDIKIKTNKFANLFNVLNTSLTKVEIEGDIYGNGKSLQANNLEVITPESFGSAKASYITKDNLLSLFVSVDKINLSHVPQTQFSFDNNLNKGLINKLSNGVSSFNKMHVKLEINADFATFNQIDSNDFKFSFDVDSDKRILRSLRIKGLPYDTYLGLQGSFNKAGNFFGRSVIRSAYLPKFSKLININLKNDFISIPRQFFLRTGFKLNQDSLELLSSSFKTENIDVAIDSELYDFNSKSFSPKIHIKKLNLDSYLRQNKNTENDEYNIFNLIRIIDVNLRKLDIDLIVDKIILADSELRDLRANIKHEDGVLFFDNLVFYQGKEQGRGYFSIDINDFIPEIEGDIDLPILDLEIFMRLLGLYDPKNDNVDKYFTKSADQGDDSRWAKDRIDLSYLKTLKSNIRTRIKEIKVGDGSIKNASFDVKTDERFININNVQSSIWGNAFEFNIAISNRFIPVVNLSFSATNLDIRKFLDIFLGFKNISGRTGMTGSLKLKGTNVEELILSATGNIKVLARNIFVQGHKFENINKQLREIKQKQKAEVFLRSLKSPTNKKNYYDSLITDFSVSLGVIYINGLKLSVPGISESVLTGSINLKDYTIDAVYTMLLRKVGRNIQATISGDIEDIKTEWDLNELEKYWQKIHFGR